MAYHSRFCLILRATLDDGLRTTIQSMIDVATASEYLGVSQLFALCYDEDNFAFTSTTMKAQTYQVKMY